MIGTINENLLNCLTTNDFKDYISNGKVGIEKECLRISKGKIVESEYPRILGSALCNKYITTDFSESLLEFITEPFSNREEVIIFLDNIHHFTSLKIKNEQLWPLSYPPHIDNMNEILIAKYGSSNLAKLKRAYRVGLANRYGKQMQIIAGIHYNYSLPDVFWKKISFERSTTQIRAKNEIYFRGLRNIQRMNWLILYFLGASPMIPKNFRQNCPSEFIEKDDYYYSKHATSLRMSKYGYQNINQKKLNVSFNSLKDYSQDLKFLTQTSSKEFEEILNDPLKELQQISTNYLQTEDEYYSIARPKSSEESDRRIIKKLNDKGTEYIEYRAIDLNPFTRIGIEKEDIYFLEIFLIYCSLKESPFLYENEIAENYNNSSLVSLSGRDLKLKLSRKGEDILMKDWASEILDEMTPIAESLRVNREVLERKREELRSPEKTISGRILETIANESFSYNELGTFFSEKYSQEYLSQSQEDNIHFDLLENIAEQSIINQSKIEESNEETFEKYLENYFSD